MKHRKDSKLAKASRPALVVRDVVRRGVGRRSRIDLTIVSESKQVRLTGIPVMHALSYREIERAALAAGLLLPYFRFGDQVWREVLSPALANAQLEPWLEGEDIEDAIAGEIRAVLVECERGEGARGLIAGKVVERGERLLMRSETLVMVVQARFAEDALSRKAIAEAAAAHLGMRPSRPRVKDSGSRISVWAFPRSEVVARNAQAAEDRHTKVRPFSKQAGSSNGDPQKTTIGQSPRNRLEEASIGQAEVESGSNGGSIHGSGLLEPISSWDDEMRAGSSGTGELQARSLDCDPRRAAVGAHPSRFPRQRSSLAFVDLESRSNGGSIHGSRVQEPISRSERDMHAGSNGSSELHIEPGDLDAGCDRTGIEEPSREDSDGR